MKILILNYEYPPLGGGTGVACQYLLKEFSKKKNLQIDHLTSSVDKHQEEQVSSNIRIIKLNIGKNNKNLHHQSFIDLLRYLIQSSWWLIKNKDQYDLIHAFGGLPASMTAFVAGKPYLVSLRGGDQPGYEPRLDKYLKPVKPLIKLIYSKAKFVDANSLYLKQLSLQSFPKLKTEVIKNGVNTKVFYPAKKLLNKPVILCNSRLGQRKGVEFLVKAMPEVVISFPKVKLIIVGQGIEEKMLKQLVSELKLTKHIQFDGKISRNKIPAIYRQACLFTLPSLSESFSNSLLEALASGLPIVATRIGGNPELVDKKNGVLVPTEKVRPLAKAIIKLLKDRKVRESMGLESRLKSTKLSWKLTADKYLDLYRRVALVG
jgi:glycosyltransferase involved in cell wall biosynthesis